MLLYPHDALPAGVKFEDIVRIWSCPGAVVPVNGRSQHAPQELYGAGRSEGASALLDLEMRMFQQVSGVTGALQGQTAGGNVSASLYESQVQNATVALLDVFETFNSFRCCRDEKVRKCGCKN